SISGHTLRWASTYSSMRSGRTCRTKPVLWVMREDLSLWQTWRRSWHLAGPTGQLEHRPCATGTRGAQTADPRDAPQPALGERDRARGAVPDLVDDRAPRSGDPRAQRPGAPHARRRRTARPRRARGLVPPPARTRGRREATHGAGGRRHARAGRDAVHRLVDDRLVRRPGDHDTRARADRAHQLAAGRQPRQPG